MTFNNALTEVFNYGGIVRSGWNGKGMFVAQGYFGRESDPLVKTLFIHATDGKEYPWVPSQQDIFADDWEML